MARFAGRDAFAASNGTRGCGTTSLRELQGGSKVRQREQHTGRRAMPTTKD
jgi:hypothetical protein